MTYEELYSKFLELQKENSLLREKLGETFQPEITETLETPISEAEITGKVNNQSSPAEKIELFMSLFKGRSDVCAKRYDNKSGKKGYTPYCLNEWKTGLCDKKAARCIECKNKNFLSLDQQVIEEHLTGKKVIGIYPITDNETCYFLAIDFDGDGWIEDIKTVKKICNEFEIPCAIEKSRSGNGGHLWFFFSEEIEATLARKLGTSMLTYSMGFRHEIKFSSYDRLFPNQDTLPQGGLGNLIALPLQKEARRRGNSEFINDEFMSIADQWSFLSNISLISKDELRTFISGLSSGNELGDLKQTDEDDETPWEPRRTQTRLLKKEIPKNFEIIIANQIFIKKAGFSQKALNSLQRLAAFKNPEFYKAQAMRLPTKDKPRVISTSEETNNFLCLPRGCENDLKNFLLENKAKANWRDERNEGSRINVEFNGLLRDEQSQAASSLLQNDNGVLSATTAFGKTVIGAYVISKRKVNTLILVHTRELLEQWKNSLTKFLVINEIVPDRLTKTGRKKKQDIIGQLGAGKKQTNGIIDIATMQSLTSDGDIMDFVQDYGMVIVDECHHVSAFSFEKVMKKVKAKYVFGLTATPTRRDGHHPIIFLQCGPIRYKVDAKKQAEKRPFEHYVIPRLTSLVTPPDNKKVNIQSLYAQICESDLRNELIVSDVKKSVKEGRNPVVLTERTIHVDLLVKKLKETIPEVIKLTGGMSPKESRQQRIRLANLPSDAEMVVVATGKYLGEGFDEPRLDTLFLTMPISWKGTLQQYAGRLHRLYENKKEVQVYDYIDLKIPMLNSMYYKRLKGYASIGYKVKGESRPDETPNVIYNTSDFILTFYEDLALSKKSIFISCPSINSAKVTQFYNSFASALARGIEIIIVTKTKQELNINPLKGIEQLVRIGTKVIEIENLSEKFAVIDNKIVWFGNVSILGYSPKDENIVRLENIQMAKELLDMNMHLINHY